MRDTKLTVTCLMPGAIETEFFKRADMMDTKVGTKGKFMENFTLELALEVGPANREALGAFSQRCDVGKDLAQLESEHLD